MQTTHLLIEILNGIGTILSGLFYFSLLLRKNLQNHIYLLGIFLLYTLAEIVSYALYHGQWHNVFNSILQILSISFILLFCYREKPKQTLQYLFVFIFTASILEFPMLEIADFIATPMSSSLTDCLSVWMSSSILLLFFVLYGRKLTTEDMEPLGRLYPMTLFVLAGSALMFSIVKDIPPLIFQNKALVFSEIFLILGELSILTVIYSVVYFFNQKSEKGKMILWLEQYNFEQKEYYTMLLKKEEETRKFRHDIKNELLEIHQFAKTGDCDRILSYIKEINADFDAFDHTVYTVGNPIADVLLNYYLQQVDSRCNIVVSGFIPSSMKTGPELRDFTIILSNLLSNATEAVMHVSVPNPFIKVKIFVSDTMMEIEMQNSADLSSVRMKDGRPMTTKKDAEHHGLGTLNILSVTKKHGGHCFFTAKEDTFTANIYLPLD